MTTAAQSQIPLTLCQPLLNPTTAEQEPPNPTTAEQEPPNPTTVEREQCEDNLRLRIPIERYRTLKQTHSTTTQTMSFVVVDQEPDLQPTLCDELPTELIDSILDQLRQDPDLNNMINDIDELINSDLMGINLEIPEYTLLEKELEHL